MTTGAICLHNRLISSIAILIFIASVLLFCASRAYADTVPIDVAKVAAANMLPKFYKGDWHYFAHFVYYDLEDKPEAYAIVFLKPELQPITLEEVEATMTAAKKHISSLVSSIDQISNMSGKSGRQKNLEISAIRKQINSTRANDILGIHSFATVVTGAKDIMPVVLKCHKGLPNVFIKKAEAIELAKKAYPNRQWEVGRFFYLGAFDEAFEVRLSSPSDMVVHEGQTVGSIVVDTNTRHIKTMSQLRDKKEEIELKRRVVEKGKDSLYDEAEAWEKKNKKKWDNYRRLHTREESRIPKTKVFQADKGVEKALPVTVPSKEPQSIKKYDLKDDGAAQDAIAAKPPNAPVYSTEE